MKILPAKKSWERRPDETDTSYHRFSIYLKIGPERSIKQVAEKLQKGSGYEKHLRRWSSKYAWVERAAEYDNYVTKELVKKEIDVKKEIIGELLKGGKKAARTLIEITGMENYTESNFKTSNVQNRIRAAEAILNRIGVVELKPEEVNNTGGNVTINNYVQNIYEKMRHLDNKEKNKEAG